MKNLFKFTTAALALVAFASCSNEDLFSSANDQLQQDKNGILVEVEDLIDANTTLTRASYTPALVDGKKQGVLNWNTTDIIRVTDATMVKYDKYGYNGSAFAFDATATGRSSAKVTEPKYASYPDANMVWDNADWEATGQYVINPAASWAEDFENDGAFVAELPLWGTAETDATYGIKTSLKYLTGVLRINLENLPGNATNVKVEGWKNLAGTQEAPMASDVTSTNPNYFEAVYATDDVLDENATLVPVDGNDYVNYIDVDVTGATLSESTIFLPLIVQKYGLLRISYSNDNGTTYTKFKDIENLNVARRTWYNFTPADQFEVSGVYPSDITAVLAEKAAQSEISIKTGKTTQVVTGDQTITIPETSADITLDLLELKAAGETALYIDAAGDYAGTLTLNVATTDLSNVFINLPSATVVVNKLGTAGTTDLGKNKTPGLANEPNGLIAKCLVIGEEANIKTIWANAELGIGNDGNPDLKLVKGSVVDKIRFEQNYKADAIEINGTVNNAVQMTDFKDLDGNLIPNVTVTVGNGANVPGIKTTGDVTVTGGTVAGFVTTDGNVTVSGVAATGVTAGSITGNINALTAPSAAADAIVGTVTLEGEATVGGKINAKTNHTWTLEVKDKAGVAGLATVDALTINGTKAYVTDATVAGDVTITDTQEAEAVKGTLTMAASKTLNLNGGYIKTLDISAASSAANAVTIAHGTAANYTAIGTLTGSNYVFSGKSVWNGKTIGSTFTGYTTGKVYTAIQLASLPASTASVEVYSNIDLNNQNWSGTGFTGTSFAFAGKDINAKTSGNQYPTIENLNLYAANNSAVTGLGFIKSATSATLSNFTLKTVSTSFKSNKTVTGVGALIGSVTTGATIDGVTVNGAEIGSTAYCKEVGGLVGNSTGTITLKSVTATGLTLNGDVIIGGVVGKTTNTGAPVDVTASSTINVTAINVPEDHQATPDITKVAEKKSEYGAVGMIAGEAKAAVIVTTGTLTVNDLITGHRQAMGYTWYYENPGPALRYYHGLNGDKNKSVKDWVWVGLRSDLTVTTAITTTAAFQGTYGTTTAALMIQHDVYDACDE